MNIIPKVSRNERVAASLKKEMSLLLRDMKLGSEYKMVNIVTVVVTNDLKSAIIYVDYCAHVENSSTDQAELLKSLDKNTGYFKKMLAKRIQLKYMPKLKFRIDSQNQAIRRVNDIIDNL
jgi:ribosome-binding factor A